MTEENTNIHESDTGIQAFDVTPAPEPQPVPGGASDDDVPAEQAQAANPYQAIIDQQTAQIDALMKHTERLNAQIAQMVQGGAQFTDNQQPQPQPQPMQQFNPPALSDDDDFSLEALGREIGKPNKPDGA